MPHLLARGRDPVRHAAFAVAVLVVSAACAGSGVPVREGIVQAPTSRAAQLQAVLVTSQVVVGEQRVGIGILERNSPVSDARVHLRVYRNSPSDPAAREADAPFKGEGLLGAGVYAARLTFATPGAWTMDVTARRGVEQPSVTRLSLTVLPTSTVPSVGQPAPRSRNLTKKDVPDLSYIDTGLPPNDMHDLSIAEAIDQRRPTLVVFATPGFCPSAMCGPEVHAVSQLQPTYRERVSFIHVEIYEDFKPDPTKKRLTATVREWRLQTEPWVFLIDDAGVIRAAFEGPAATDELREALDAMLKPR